MAAGTLSSKDRTAESLTRCVVKMCCILDIIALNFAKALVDGCCVSKGIGGICIESDQHPTASDLQEDAPGPSGDVPFL